MVNCIIIIINFFTFQPNASIIDEFILLMAACHTVVPERDDDAPGEIIYQASSPDERALVLAAQELDYVFTTRTPTHVTVDVVSDVKECFGEEKKLARFFNMLFIVPRIHIDKNKIISYYLLTCSTCKIYFKIKQINDN